MTSRVKVSAIEDGIFEVAVDDAEGNNHLNDGLALELAEAFEGLAREPTLKVALMSGRKDVFCAGSTLGFIKDLARESGRERYCYAVQEKMLALPAPIVGALEGHAVGGGFIVALCCDILIAAEERRYSANFTDLGFTPGAGATSLLPLMVGHHFASEMLLTAKYYKGKELKGRGLFNDVVPAREVVPAAMDLCRRMAAKPRHVIALLKETLAMPRRKALQEAMTREPLMHKLCFSHPESASRLDEAYRS